MENIDTSRRVLFEQEEDDGYMYGFTENYIKVKVPFDKALTNTFQMVKLIAIDSEGIMRCEPIMQKILLN